MRIKVGDEVQVVAGDDKGERGTVQRVIKSKNQVVISGVNIVKKHQKPQSQGGRQVQGGIIEFEAPVDASKVMLVCPETDEPTRVSVRRDEDGNRIRVSKRSGSDID